MNQGIRPAGKPRKWENAEFANALPESDGPALKEAAIRATRKGISLPPDLTPYLDTFFGKGKRPAAAQELQTLWETAVGIGNSSAPPPQTASFPLARPPRLIGRDPDVASLVAALLAGKPVNLLLHGTGGVGKTTLSRAVATHHAIIEHFDVSRWPVPLETATDATTVATAIIRAIGLDPATNNFDDALRHLDDETPKLLVLDNLETPWRAQPRETEALLARLAAAKGLSLIATLRGEQQPLEPAWHPHPLAPLLPADAAELFRQIAPIIDADDPDLPPLLQALGGLPLAIELVAFRAHASRLAHTAELWQEWQESGTAIARRLGIPPDRLTSLDHSIALSVGHLSLAGHRLFALLGALPAGLADADRRTLLGADSLAARESLVGLGLATTPPGRLDLLPPIRDHAARHYKPTPPDQAAWPAHFRARIDTTDAEHRSGSGTGSITRLLPDLPNLAAALRAATAAADPANTQRQRSLFVSHTRFGDVQVAQGDLAAALSSYRAARAIAKRLAAADPANTQWQRDLYVSQDRIGRIREAQGDLAAALSSYRAAHAIAERLATTDPANAQRQRDLSVSQDKLGDVQVAQGDLAAALSSYRAAHAIRERLAAADAANTEGQRDLFISHIKLGDVQAAQGDLAAALSSYRAARAIAERLAAADPANTRWQRDLSVSHNRLGDVQRAQGDLPAALSSYRATHAIAERIAAADPANTGWQHDLSVSHSRLGDVQRAQGDLAAALSSYRADLAIAERLAAADPANAEWQRNLSVSHNKLGNVQVAQGDLAAALSSYRAALAIAERLAAADPANAQWQRDLAVSFANLATVEPEAGAARALLRRGRAIIATLAARSPENAQLRDDLAEFDAAIARCTP